MKRRVLYLIVALWFGAILNTAVFWGDIRFRFPLEPTLAIAAGLIMDQKRKRPKKLIRR